MTTHDEDGEWVEVGTTDGIVLRRIPNPDPAEQWRYIEESVRRMRDAMTRMADTLSDLPPIQVRRGGIEYPPYSRFLPDRRKGEEVYVYDLLPGTRVYVLEDVFTVDRVDMDAPLPTVWLKELPTSPLYFSEDEYIYLANETED